MLRRAGPPDRGTQSNTPGIEPKAAVVPVSRLVVGWEPCSDLVDRPGPHRHIDGPGSSRIPEAAEAQEPRDAPGKECKRCR
jgi:hypothetical protein